MKSIVGILGSTGFVGINLTRMLTENGHTVIGGSRRTGVDARDTWNVINWISSNKIDTVINLAAECGGIGLNKLKPADLWTSTTRISSAVLEACRLQSVRKLVMTGTVCSYAKHCPIPFKESYLMNYGIPEETNMAYGMAKLSSLFGAQVYAQQYNMNISCLIPVNMYGPHDNFNEQTSHVIPAIINKISNAIKNNDKSITLWGDGTPTREFLYVDDCARAIMMAIDESAVNDPSPINIGNGSEISINKIATTISEIMGYSGTINWDTTKPNGQPRRSLDVSKAKYLLGFEARVPLQDGLKKTINWYNNQ